METVLVYRMEDDTGEGGYAAMSWDDYMAFSFLHDIDGHPDFPTPGMDYGLTADPVWSEFAASPRPGIVFGCCAPETLREWFPASTLPLLERNSVDFTVWRVPVDKVARSARQAVFFRPDAECVLRRPAADLYRELELKEAA